jgi:uncharacterized membrane protein YqhA
MTTLDLKQHLFHQIVAINYVNFLKALKTFLDAKQEETTLKVSQNQKNEIIASKNEIEKGLYLNSSELEIEFEKWAKK